MKLFQIMQRNKTGIAGALQVPFMENEAAHNYIIECIVRCYQHDYGMMPPEDVKANEAEIEAGEGRIVARYEAGPGMSEDMYVIVYFSDSHPETDYNYTTACYVSDY